ncbi:MAG TPA: ABC transporter substrate-binding protein [Chloroflexota bacterium]|nr:ABC transporter substrate-binding protein [Chloroflexota bacterium]
MARLLLVAVLLSAALGACAPAASGPAPPRSDTPVAASQAAPPAVASAPSPLRVEVALPALTGLIWPFVIIRDGPIGAQEHLALDWTIVETDARAVQALLGGSVDLAEAAMDAVARAADQGGDVVSIGGNINHPPYAIAARPEITSFAELRGKKFAVTDLRGGSTVMLKLLLQANGLREGDYDLLPLGGTPNRYTALANGVVDATILGQPADFRAQDEGFRILAYTTDLEYQFTTYAIRRSWGEQNREAVQRILRALVLAHRWLHDPANRERAVELGERALRSSRAEMERTWDLYYQQHAGRVMPRNAELNRAGIETVVRTLVEQGEIREGGIERFIDERYLQEVLRGL